MSDADGATKPSLTDLTGDDGPGANTAEPEARLQNESGPDADGQDQVRVGIAAGGDLRWVAVDVSATAEEARRRHDLSPLAAVALGRALAGAALLQRFAIKSPSRLILEAQGDGPLRRVIAEADSSGNLRGLVGEPHVSGGEAGSSFQVGAALGQGRLRVFREKARDAGEGRGGSTYSSQVELVTGELGTDLAHFLHQSEQVRSAVMVGVFVDPDGVAATGGLLIEALPGTDDALVRGLETRLIDSQDFSRGLMDGGVEGTLDRYLGDLDPQTLEHQPLRFECPCDWNRLQSHLVMLPEEERGDLFEADGTVGVTCAFCGAEQRFSRGDLSLH